MSCHSPKSQPLDWHEGPTNTRRSSTRAADVAEAWISGFELGSLVDALVWEKMPSQVSTLGLDDVGFLAAVAHRAATAR